MFELYEVPRRRRKKSTLALGPFDAVKKLARQAEKKARPLIDKQAGAAGSKLKKELLNFDIPLPIKIGVGVVLVGAVASILALATRR